MKTAKNICFSTNATRCYSHATLRLRIHTHTHRHHLSTDWVERPLHKRPKRPSDAKIIIIIVLCAKNHVFISKIHTYFAKWIKINSNSRGAQSSVRVRVTTTTAIAFHYFARRTSASRSLSAKHRRRESAQFRLFYCVLHNFLNFILFSILKYIIISIIHDHFSSWRTLSTPRPHSTCVRSAAYTQHIYLHTNNKTSEDKKK